MIAVHDVLRGLGEFLDELVGRRGAAEHRVDALRPHLLLLHGAGEQHVLIVVVGRDHEVGVLRLDLEHDVVEVARRRRMRDGFAAPGSRARAVASLRSLARPAPNAESSCTIITVLAALPAWSLMVTRLSSAVLAMTPKPGPKRKVFFRPRADDAVGHADVDDVGQVVARRGLARGKADAAGVAADDRGDAGRVHLLDFGVAAFRRRLRVAEHRLDLGAAERLDAAGRVDLLDRDASRRCRPCWPE